MRWLGHDGPARRLVLGGVLLVGLAGKAHDAMSAEAGRDPFVFGSREDEAVGQPGRAGLSGILWDATSPLAVVGGEFFTVGQTYQGWRILAIHQDHIVIEQDGRRESLVSGSPWPD